MYVDDILVKRHASGNHVDNLKKISTTLCQYWMNLNPAKCAFRVTSMKFLEFMVSHLDIEVNHKKTRAMREMNLSRSIKEVQHVTSKGAILNKYVSRSFKQCLSFFKTLKWPMEFL